MNSSRLRAISKVLLGIFSTLFGLSLLAFGLWILYLDLQAPASKAPGLWILCVIPGLLLSVGGIGTVLGRRKFLWLQFFSSSAVILAALLFTGGHLFRYINDFFVGSATGSAVAIALLSIFLLIAEPLFGFLIVISCTTTLQAGPLKPSASLTGDECKKVGHIVSGLSKLRCGSDEIKIGNVKGYKCACICCASDAPQRLLLSKIPVATKKSVPDIHDSRDWKNPYLTVRADGIEFADGNRVSIDDLEAALAAIPLNNWPYGRIVAVQESGIRSKFEGDRRDNMKRVLDLLKNLGVRVQFWPSA